MPVRTAKGVGITRWLAKIVAQAAHTARVRDADKPGRHVSAANAGDAHSQRRGHVGSSCPNKSWPSVSHSSWNAALRSTSDCRGRGRSTLTSVRIQARVGAHDDDRSARNTTSGIERVTSRVVVARSIWET